MTHKPNLLIPDTRSQAHIVYEAGKLYPHHNLYFVTSDAWDLHALQAVPLSNVIRLMMASTVANNVSARRAHWQLIRAGNRAVCEHDHR